MSIVFIIGAGRSGTTSMLEILRESSFTYCASEPYPNLNEESRFKLDGSLLNPFVPLLKHLGPRISIGLSKRPIYIEKQISLVPFIQDLFLLFNCKFIIMKRDGRDVVSSLINWHNQMYPIIYQECKDSSQLSPRAKLILENQVGYDPFDFSLPRPKKDNPWYDSWNQFSRFEMVSWYWNEIYSIILKQVSKINGNNFIFVDYTNPKVDDIIRVFNFLNIDDIDETVIQKILNKKVNSLENRINELPKFPKWKDWNESQLNRFFDLASDSFIKLGYSPSSIRPEPKGFGEFWKKNETDDDWYSKIYIYRKHMHLLFAEWLNSINNLHKIDSIVEIGCGIFSEYPSIFEKISYIGVDISEKVIKRNLNNHNQTQLKFLNADIIKESLSIEADLVFSHATIDNVYDMDAFIDKISKISKKLIYITNYRGYFKNLKNHRYRYDPSTKVFFNDISPYLIEKNLKKNGFKTICIFPQKTFRDDISYETVVIASRDKTNPYDLMIKHKPESEYKHYKFETSNLTLDEEINLINYNSFSYCDSNLNLVNDLSFFKEVAKMLKRLKNISLLTVNKLKTNNSDGNLAIRLDIDIDIISAVEISKISFEYKIPVSFYILHTASYYGSVSNNVFLKNDCMKPLYLELSHQFSEVGLHVDPYFFYLNFDIDGSQAVVSELKWLRSIGLNIDGISGHNCAPVYGLESFEIFNSWKINQNNYYIKDFTVLPIGILDHEQYDLKYEAGAASKPSFNFSEKEKEDYLNNLPKGDFIRNRIWMKKYLFNNPYCEWGYTYNIWLIGKNRWVISGKINGNKVYMFNVKLDVVETFLSFLKRNETCIIHIHPIYLGKRETPNSYPNLK